MSLVLSADAKADVAGLTAFREERPADWILLFARAIERAAAKASELAKRLAELQERWRDRAGRARRHSSAEALIVELPAHPVVTVATALKVIGRSKQAVNEALACLADKGVLHPVTPAKRNRAWEARELFDLINDAERELATPSDEDVSPRPSPQGRRSRRAGRGPLPIAWSIAESSAALAGGSLGPPRAPGCPTLPHRLPAAVPGHPDELARVPRAQRPRTGAVATGVYSRPLARTCFDRQARDRRSIA